MSDIQDGDKFLVNRSNQSYQLNVEELQDKLLDNDFLLVNRSNKSYKMKGSDFKNSLKVPPTTGEVVLVEDNDEGARFTSQSFTTTPDFVSGNPEPILGVKAYVDGNLYRTPTTSEIVDVDVTVQPVYSARIELQSGISCPADAVKEKLFDGVITGGNYQSQPKNFMQCNGNGKSINYKVFFDPPIVADSMQIQIASHLSPQEGFCLRSKASDGSQSSQSKGALGGWNTNQTSWTWHNIPKASGGDFAEIQIGNDTSRGGNRPVAGNGGIRLNGDNNQLLIDGSNLAVLVFDDNTDLASLESGDRLYQDNAVETTSITYTAQEAGGSWTDTANATDGNENTYARAEGNGGEMYINFDPPLLSGSILAAVRDKGGSNSPIALCPNAGSLTNAKNYNPDLNEKTEISITDLVNSNNANYRNGIAMIKLFTEVDVYQIKGVGVFYRPAPSGTISSVDIAAKSVSLTQVIEEGGNVWSANTGNYALGPAKRVTDTRLYCELDENTLEVKDLVADETPFTTFSGNSAKIKFPAVLPSGQFPDDAMPSGTSIQTTLSATNNSGTFTRDSNVVTPTNKCDSGEAAETDAIQSINEEVFTFAGNQDLVYIDVGDELHEEISVEGNKTTYTLWKVLDKPSNDNSGSWGPYVPNKALQTNKFDNGQVPFGNGSPAGNTNAAGAKQKGYIYDIGFGNQWPQGQVWKVNQSSNEKFTSAYSNDGIMWTTFRWNTSNAQVTLPQAARYYYFYRKDSASSTCGCDMYQTEAYGSYSLKSHGTVSNNSDIANNKLSITTYDTWSIGNAAIGAPVDCSTGLWVYTQQIKNNTSERQALISEMLESYEGNRDEFRANLKASLEAEGFTDDQISNLGL